VFDQDHDHHGDKLVSHLISMCDQGHVRQRYDCLEKLYEVLSRFSLDICGTHFFDQFFTLFSKYHCTFVSWFNEVFGGK
jgi:hypothetical protein